MTVSSGTDSRTIIDMNGAEKLLGNGDMLFYPSGYVKPVRLQGAYVSDEEVQRTVQYLVSHSSEVVYETSIEEKLSEPSKEDGEENGRDEYFEQAARLCIEKDKGSTSMLQRQFRVGFNRAARIMEQLYDAGIVGQEEQNKPRKNTYEHGTNLMSIFQVIIKKRSNKGEENENRYSDCAGSYYASN